MKESSLDPSDAIEANCCFFGVSGTVEVGDFLAVLAVVLTTTVIVTEY